MHCLFVDNKAFAILPQKLSHSSRLSNMISRNNEYKIIITIENPSDNLLLDKMIPYQGSASFQDRLIVKDSMIEITCNRSKVIELEEIFHNNNSSLNSQITKSLLYYYGRVGKYFPIKRIAIKRSGTKGVLKSYKLENDKINQLLKPGFILPYKLAPAVLEEIFGETEKGTLLRNALSHYLVANAKENEADRFEKLWKSFNAIYKQLTGHSTDHKALADLRTFALQHQASLVFSNNRSSKISFKHLSTLRWRAMIQNDYPTSKKTLDFIAFVKRYNDERILSCLKDREFANQKQHLNAVQMNDLLVHITSKKVAKTTNNTELTTFLTGKYGYFVRNKNFHGEKIDSEFRLTDNKEKLELVMLNDVLNSYVADLFNLS